MKVAIVGRRNVGKSTFINTLVSAPRMIVSEVPGTTRDSVDVRFELDGKPFVAIDTPGIRRAKSRQTDIDFYGTHRAQRSIRRADVVLLFFDATQRISKVDKQLCDYIAQQYKPCVFVVNKWDQLVNTMPTGKWVRYLHDAFGTMRYAPIAFITGQTGKNVKALINHGQMLFKQSRARVYDRPAQSHAPRSGAAKRAAAGPQPRAEDLLRHAGRHPAADDRAVRERPVADFEAVPALPARQVPRRAELRRSADQALSAAPSSGRRARRHRTAQDDKAGATSRTGNRQTASPSDALIACQPGDRGKVSRSIMRRRSFA